MTKLPGLDFDEILAQISRIYMAYFCDNMIS